MSPITAEEAWAATDPSHRDEDRERSAAAILQGVAANDAYYASRSELERLKALAQGGQVAVHADLNKSPEVMGSGDDQGMLPTESDTATDAEVVEDGPGVTPAATLTGAAASLTGAAVGSGEPGSGSPGPDNPVDSVATLRKQLQDAGITPEA